MIPLIIFLLIIAVGFLFVALSEAKQSIQKFHRLTAQMFERLGSVEAELKTLKADQAAAAEVEPKIGAEAATILPVAPPPLPAMAEPLVRIQHPTEAANQAFPPLPPQVEIPPPPFEPLGVEPMVILPTVIEPVVAEPILLEQAKAQDATPELEVAALQFAPVVKPTLTSQGVDAPTAPPPPPIPHAASPVAPPAPKASFEMRLGTYWLVRIGVVMLLTGLVFLGTYAYKNWIGKLGPGGKVSLLYLASGFLLGLGAWLYRREKKESVKNYAQVLFAGGLAAVYFTTYAAHWLPNLRVITSALADGALLLAWAGFIVWLADRRKSEVLALFAIGLAYYTSFITNVGAFTLCSNLVLTSAAVFFLVRNRWATLSLASLAATYAGFAFWRFHHQADGAALTSGELWLGNGFLSAYWVLFTAAVFLSRSESLAGAKRAAFASVNNAAFFSLVLLSMMHVDNGNFWLFSLCYGSGQIALAALARRFLSTEPAVKKAFLTQGILLVTVGFIAKFSGLNLALVLAAESVVLRILSDQQGSFILRVGALVAGVLAVCWGVADVREFDWSSQIVGTAVGALMLFNAWWSRRGGEPAVKERRTEQNFFTVLALLMWAITTWRNTAPGWLALAFAVESALFVVASGRLANKALWFGAFPFAALSVAWAVSHQLPTDATGLWSGAAIGALLLFNAGWERASRSAQLALIQTCFFSALALLMWGATTWNYVPSDWRALAFAIESTVFLVASLPLRNLVLEYGAYPAALFAAGLVVWAMKPIGTFGLAYDVVTGGLLLANSFLGRNPPRVAGHVPRAFQVNFFTVLALMVWLWTTWRNTAAEYRGLLLALQSMAFLVVGQRLGSLELVIGGRAFGVLAVAGASLHLMGGFDTHPAVGWAVAWPHALTGALMLGNALIERRKRTESAGEIVPPITFFTGLALGMWLATTWGCAPGDLRSPLLAAEALVFTASLSLLALTELTLFGQAFLFIAQLTCAGLLAGSATTLPWWNPTIVIAATFAHEHWWQRARSHPWLAQARTFLLGAYAFAATALLFQWLQPQFSAPHWLGFSSLLAVVLTGYGAMTRAWFLTGGAQLFLVASVFEFLSQLYFEPSAQKPEWSLALAPIATLIALSQAAMRGLAQGDLTKTRLAEQVGLVALVYRVTAFVLSLGWVFKYIPMENRFTFLALVGTALFAFSGWRQSREALWMGGVFTLMGLLLFVFEIGTPKLAYWANLPAILLLLAQQRAARRLPERYALPEALHTAAIIVGSCSVWLFLSRWVTLKAGGFDIYLTASWAGLALVIFVAGFGCRERIYRWHGLAVLACAIGRVLIFDVWKLETIYRILSFMALGVVLMVLGFIYNKYEEKIKEWL